ncbi:uncharacterized protein LOC134536652 [Bacillus rossius redtenbacheri]|uniref:uncharacterized protein LOC134536652 n=1 Tax=Bacillus rossius redtenbacheri TaxID=93214 RepID=UPI002FDEEA34
MFPRGKKFDNDTIDVVNKGCFDNYDTLACVRTSFLTILSAITLVFVILKIVKYHVYRHPQLHHYVIFYVSAVLCFMCGASFMAGARYPQLDFSACFLKLLQFALICHLHWSLGARAARREDVVQHVVNPVLCLYVLYCTTVALMGMVDVTGSWTQCMRPYWLMLSSADLVLVQLFVVMALYMTHRSEGLSSLASFKSTQKRDLWSVVVVYEVSAVLAVTLDAIMRFVGSEVSGCSGLFGHTQVLYSTVMAVFAMAKFLLPTWVLLCVFQPVEGDAHNSEVALASRYSLDCQTDTGCSSIRGYHQYRRMFVPEQSGVLPALQDEYPFPELQKQQPAGLPVAGLSTINEESGSLSVLESPVSGSLRSDAGELSRAFGHRVSC